MQTERTLVIVGVGLIGGSVAAAARKAMPELRIVGIGRSPERLQAAVDQGLLDAWHLQAAVGQWSDDAFGLVCLPVDQITAAAKQLLQAGCSTVTDAGSVKEPICNLLQNERDLSVHIPLPAASRAVLNTLLPICSGSESAWSAAIRISHRPPRVRLHSGDSLGWWSAS